jgi:hypothetical protein
MAPVGGANGGGALGFDGFDGSTLLGRRGLCSKDPLSEILREEIIKLWIMIT